MAMPERGRFAWGDALVGTTRPEGLPVSAVVAALVRRIDGRATIAELAQTLRSGVQGGGGVDLQPVVEAAVRTLYEDGLIDRVMVPS